MHNPLEPLIGSMGIHTREIQVDAEVELSNENINLNQVDPNLRELHQSCSRNSRRSQSK